MMADARRVVEKVKNPRKDKEKEAFYCESCDREISEHQYINGYGNCPDCFKHN
jgi:hypothetical protein